MKPDGIQFLGNVTFSSPPSFTLTFTNRSPAGQPVKTLDGLRDAAVTASINTALGVAGVPSSSRSASPQSKPTAPT